MKFVGVVICLYMLLLALKPCSDSIECISITTHNKPTTEQHKHEHNEDVEHCSPFCICACCGQLTYSTSFPDFQFSIELNKQRPSFSYDDSKVGSIALDIWQPPKIS
jgi:hypothetical protein